MNVYEIYQQACREDIILSFRGGITDDFMASVFSIMESRLDGTPAEQRLRKKVNAILVECLQNVYHHMEAPPGETAEDSRSAMFLVCRNAGNRYSIVTGNFIRHENAGKLKEKIDQVNAMTQEERIRHYRESLSNAELSAKGGAGLGMIDMARKSGNRIEYSFDKASNDLSFFSLIVTID